MERMIALVDCDSFFVACEQVMNPELEGKPVCVLSNNNGCIVSRSKEAKTRGVKMGAPYFLAKREFKDVIFITGKKDLYKEISNKVMNKLKTYSPLVEIYSIDEAFIDLTGTSKLYNKSYEDIVKMIREEVKAETGITVSIGLAGSKTLAKLGSDKAKSNGGIFVIEPEDIHYLLKDTRIEEIWGIGRQLCKKLARKGILTAFELISKPDTVLKSLLGVVGLRLKHELLGVCTSPVNPIEEAPQSIQQTEALKDFSSDKTYIKTALNRHIHKACAKLRKYGLLTSNVGVMLRTKDFQVISLTQELTESTNFEFEIQKVAYELFDKIFNPNIIYRSTGVYLGDFQGEANKQLTLLDSNSDKKESLARCIDKIESKFGKNSIRTGY